MPITIVLVSQLPGLLLVVVGPGPIILSILLLLLLLITWILLLILNIGVLLILLLLDSFNLPLLLFFALKSNPGSKVTSLEVMSMSMMITLLALLSWQSTQQVAGIGKCTLVFTLVKTPLFVSNFSTRGCLYGLNCPSLEL